ncbi:MAG: Phosphomannomutase [Berkelbacteria bacterium GW2011_GWA1_36_9]|uniref:Phosphomannomutase n=1 Tax=Berkelbacteria bacterium GW2011_GWA1_36_9 TaxID=1618331 RepID=A0A0G0FY36_9BACT|nr:MAG: Phosphomannomutase [Berkelbacteria bacterium GW2011_GWA1_36_9]
MDDSIFKAYDVRGVYPETIDEEIAQKIGQAFVMQFNLKKVAFGRDGRLSSPQIEKALTEGAKKAGADVTHLGIISTDMIYFLSGSDDFDGLAIVTASHNPKDNNGFKFILKGAKAVSGDEGLFNMRDLINSNNLKEAEKIGMENSREIYNEYAEKLNSLVDISKIKPLKVVLDAGSGVAYFIAQKVFKNLPIKLIPLCGEIDGNFPYHQPSPIEDKNLVDIKKKVVEEEADLGLAFDGDGDRVFLIDEKGENLSSTITTAMIAKRMLKRHPGSRILYNLLCGWVVKETIQKNGGVPEVTKVGHSLIKTKMRKEDGLFAGEHSGHYYFKDLYYADSGMLASLVIMELISEEGKPLSEIAHKYNKYFLSGEINSEVKNQEGKIEEIKNKYKDGQQSELDGISVEYTDWRFNVRPSNTEPLLRLNVEAKSKELLEQKKDELLALIRA